MFAEISGPGNVPLATTVLYQMSDNSLPSVEHYRILTNERSRREQGSSSRSATLWILRQRARKGTKRERKMAKGGGDFACLI